MLTINSGDTVSFDCLDASNGQITPSSTSASIASLVFTQLDQVNGPVYVAGAAPGDTLQIDVLSVEPADWGWTGLIPGFGLLADEFKEPALKLWKIDRGEGVAWWFDGGKKRNIGIPVRPFAGEMGVAPGEIGAFSTIPPYNTGVRTHACFSALHHEARFDLFFTLFVLYRAILIRSISRPDQRCSFRCKSLARCSLSVSVPIH